MEAKQLTLGVRVAESYTLGNFLVSSDDSRRGRLAVSAIRRLVNRPLSGPDSMVHCWGAKGTGKSHLLMAACNLAGEQGLSAGYFPLAEFIHLGPGLLQNLHSLDLVCLDDVQTVLAHRTWQEALLEHFNRILEEGGRLLSSSPMPVPEMSLELPDLNSRLSWGGSFQIPELSNADKSLLLRDRCAQLGMQLGYDAADYLLTHYSRDTADLVTLVRWLDEDSLVDHRRLTIPFIKQVIVRRRGQ